MNRKSNKMGIMIVEDKTILAHDIIDRLSSFGYGDLIGPFASGEDALLSDRLGDVRVALLDVKLKGKMTGIELAAELNKIRSVAIVYLTSQQDDQIFQEAARTSPIAFLNKPFTNNELKMALHNALSANGQDLKVTSVDSESDILSDRIFVRNGRGKFFIKLDDILWIKSYRGDTSTIMTHDRLGHHENSLPVVGYNLSMVLERLSFYPHFIRASRYYIINIKHVERILDSQPKNRRTTKKAVLIAENEIVLGDRFRKAVTDKLIQL